MSEDGKTRQTRRRRALSSVMRRLTLQKPEGQIFILNKIQEKNPAEDGVAGVLLLQTRNCCCDFAFLFACQQHRVGAPETADV